jgi:hypothetical protein
MTNLPLFVITECSLTTEFVIIKFHCTIDIYWYKSRLPVLCLRLVATCRFSMRLPQCGAFSKFKSQYKTAKVLRHNFFLNRNNKNHFNKKKQFFFKFQNDLAFLGVEIRPTSDAWKRSFAAMRNDFVWNFSNCSKRIALRFQGLKTHRIAVDACWNGVSQRAFTNKQLTSNNTKINHRYLWNYYLLLFIYFQTKTGNR